MALAGFERTDRSDRNFAILEAERGSRGGTLGRRRRAKAFGVDSAGNDRDPIARNPAAANESATPPEIAATASTARL